MALDAESSRRSKRKRTQVSYYEPNHEAEAGRSEAAKAAAGDEDEDVEVPQVSDEQSKTKRRKTGTTKNKAKPKNAKKGGSNNNNNSQPGNKGVFRLLDLPAEVRNVIYRFALEDPGDLVLVGEDRVRRPEARRGITIQRELADDDEGQATRHMIMGRFRAKIKAGELASTETLSPLLLCASRQVRREGGAVLYGQRLHFTDTKALYYFLAQVGFGNRVLVRDVVLHEWGTSSSKQGLSHAAFTLLIEATGLGRVRLNPNRRFSRLFEITDSHLDRQMGNALDGFLRGAHHWFDAVGYAKKDVLAGMDVLKLSDDDFDLHGRRTMTDEEKKTRARVEEVFRKKLEERLLKT
ncbi:hypothetical protein MBLNU459_g4131t1 [Dothideomycetes sp. NU459]